MTSKTSVGGIVFVLVLTLGAASFLVSGHRLATSQFHVVEDVVTKSSQRYEHAEEPVQSPEMIVARAIEQMIKAYQSSGKPASTEAEFVCFHGLVNVLVFQGSNDALVEANNACAKLVAEADMDVWKNSSAVEHVLAAAVAYASIESEPLVTLLSNQWNSEDYPDEWRAVLMGVLARATYLVDRDTVAGRVSCRGDFSCRMGVALSLKDQTIVYAPTVDGLPRYRVAFVTEEIEAAQGYQMFVYEVSSKDGVVGAVVLPQ